MFLGIGLPLTPEPHLVEPDSAVVGRPSRLSNRGSDLAVDLGDGRLPGALRLLQYSSVLQRSVDLGHGLSLLPSGRSQRGTSTLRGLHTLWSIIS